jgi:hypothetical protein
MYSSDGMTQSKKSMNSITMARKVYLSTLMLAICASLYTSTTKASFSSVLKNSRKKLSADALL